MISRGKRKHIVRLLRESSWNRLSDDAKSQFMTDAIDRTLDAISIAYGIPKRLLTGESK